MGILNFFKKKEKVVEPEVIWTPIGHKCSHCSRDIFYEEGWTKNNSGRYHRRCWKEVKKSVGF